MKAKHEIAAIAVMLVVCLLFAACAQKAEVKLTDKATDPALISTTTTTAEMPSETESQTETESDKNTDTYTLTADDALTELQEFYGTLYTVKKAKGKEDSPAYTVTDKNGKEYATITVDLKTGTATEKIAGTGEVNKFNLLV